MIYKGDSLMKVVNSNEFRSEISEGVVLVDFFATWCGPCKMLSPIIDELSEDRSLEVVKIDIDKNEDLVKEFGIMSVPTIVLLKDNKEVARNIGFIRKNDLESWISKNI